MGKNETFEQFFDGEYEASFPTELIERYDIVECLSVTEGCDTLLVVQKDNNRKLVAKCYRAGTLLFEQEEFFKLKCEAVPEYVGEYRNDRYRCVLREYIEGVPLDEYVRKNYITEDVILDIAMKLAEIMKTLHSFKPVIIHRDIKPENIIVREGGDLALIDFGISRIYKEKETSDTIFCGTKDFAPPEQYGFMQTDIRSDIYSFGVVLSWMITGKAKPLTEPLTKLERVAARCCEFSPNKRYKNDEALLKALNRATRKHVKKVRKRVKWCLAAVVLFVSVLTVGGTIYWSSVKEKAVTFQEPLIEEAVRLVLDKPEGILTREDLEGVTEIYIQAEEVYQTMDEFYEEGGKWYDTDSRIHGPITSLEDLRGMPNLRIIFIGAEQIEDVTPLKNLEYLQKISFRDNYIEDLTPLKDKELLSEVDLLENPLKSIDAVTTWPVIRSLGLSNTGGYDGSPIGEVKNLNYLDIKNNSDAYRYLSGKRFKELQIGAAGQRDVECIRDVIYVERLYIRWSDIQDISALEGREDIVFLNMEDCAIEDLSPLFTMPNLISVEMSAGKKDEMEKLISVYGEPKFRITYL
ncbi:MAG: protein kinase [Clostridiales bacterium]|nr:protein kinase [Clostridiales bacterium]